MTQPDLARLEGLLAKATKGPWQVSGCRVKWREAHGDHVNDSHMIGPDGDGLALVMFDPRDGKGLADAHLIVAAVNAAPALLARIAALEVVLTQCRDQFQFYANEHMASDKPVKAATNQRFADLARAALTLKENDA